MFYFVYYTADEFVCVLPSAITEGENKSHQRLLTFVLAKAQVTASTGKRGKYNMVASVLWFTKVRIYYSRPFHLFNYSTMNSLFTMTPA